MSTNKRDKAVALYAHGLTCPVIAERLGVNRKTVSTWVKAAGVEIDVRRRRYDGCGNSTSTNNPHRTGTATRSIRQQGDA